MKWTTLSHLAFHLYLLVLILSDPNYFAILLVRTYVAISFFHYLILTCVTWLRFLVTKMADFSFT